MRSTLPLTLRTRAPPADLFIDVSAGSGGLSSTTSAAAGPSASRRRWLFAEGLTLLLCVAGTLMSSTLTARAAGGSAATELDGIGVGGIFESVDQSVAGRVSAAVRRAWRRRTCGGDVTRCCARSVKVRAAHAHLGARAAPVFGACPRAVLVCPAHVRRPRAAGTRRRPTSRVGHKPAARGLCLREPIVRA